MKRIYCRPEVESKPKRISKQDLYLVKYADRGMKLDMSKLDKTSKNWLKIGGIHTVLEGYSKI